MSEGKQDNGKRKYTISNLVFGPNYSTLWLENQLKSLCDPTNLPALKKDYDIDYVVFTDEETLQSISRHPNFMMLTQHCNVPIVKLSWPPDADRFGSRYQLLVQMFHETLKGALANGAWACSVWVADLVFAKGSVPKMLSHLEKGHDAVFNVPIRSAADSVHPVLAGMPGAPSDLELFELAYANLHHLWTHSTWDNPYFTKMPYSMLWNSGTGLVAHSFGITPIVFKPSEELKAVQGVIDADVPSFFKNPYWATDWTDAAVAGVEPLSNGHYPPFKQKVQTTDYNQQTKNVAKWSMVGTQPVQSNYLHKPLFYPSEKTFRAAELGELYANGALEIAMQIQQEIQQLRDGGNHERTAGEV
jgi:hypothetical protein